MSRRSFSYSWWCVSLLAFFCFFPPVRRREGGLPKGHFTNYPTDLAVSNKLPIFAIRINHMAWKMISNSYTYDYDVRHYDAVLCLFPAIDPLCEKYYYWWRIPLLALFFRRISNKTSEGELPAEKAYHILLMCQLRGTFLCRGSETLFEDYLCFDRPFVCPFDASTGSATT